MAVALSQEEQGTQYFRDAMSCARVDFLSFLKLNTKILKTSKGILIHKRDFP